MKTIRISKTALLSMSLLATASFGGGNSSVGTERPQTVAVEGYDANLLEGILDRALLPIPSGVPTVGYASVSTDEASCSRVVYPGATATCVLTKTVDGVRSERNLVNKDANDLFDIISKYVGLRSPAEVGYGVGRGDTLNITCGHVVIPNAVTTCEITTVPSQN